MRKELRQATAAIMMSLFFALTLISPGAANHAKQGCEPAFWKSRPDLWVGYTPGQTLASVFTFPSALSHLSGFTLMEGLGFRDDDTTTVEGTARSLLKDAVASLLNAAHPDVHFPGTVAGVVSETNKALASLSISRMLELLVPMHKANNNLGCPLKV